MLDPFLRPIPSLSRLVEPFAQHYNFPTLPNHIHEVLFAFLLYQLTQSFFSPVLSGYLFPKIYHNLNRRTKLNWDVHVVSLLQSTLICTLALWVMWTDGERKGMDSQQRVYGYTGACGMIQGLAAGYFLWDLVISTLYVKVFGVGLWAHAVSALWVFSFGFRPFLNYYAPTFILYELSSPFLNFHWFFDKLHMTGSRAQWFNGMVLLFSFFSCRLVWGTYQSLRVYQDVWRAYRSGPLTNLTESVSDQLAKPFVLDSLIDGNTNVVKANEQVLAYAGPHLDVPMWLMVTYLGSNLCLNSLNYYWFGKMIETVMKRFRPKEEGEKEKNKKMKLDAVVEGVDFDVDVDPDGTVLEDLEDEVKRGLDWQGKKSVEVERKEVRRRKA